MVQHRSCNKSVRSLICSVITCAMPVTKAGHKHPTSQQRLAAAKFADRSGRRSSRPRSRNRTVF